jgi:hypothetical protein
MLYEEILNSGEQDAVYEFFWYNFKSSVVNFAQASQLDSIKRFAREVPVLSKKLNDLKSHKRYDDIIDEINIFLRNFLWSAIESNADSNEYSYHLNIANSNLKRWLNLPKIKDDKPEELVALKAIYSIHGPVLVNTMVPSSVNPFEIEPVITSIVRYAYSYKLEKVLTTLTQEPVTQKIVVKTLRSLGLNVPDSIRNLSKILK